MMEDNNNNPAGVNSQITEETKEPPHHPDTNIQNKQAFWQAPWQLFQKCEKWWLGKGDFWQFMGCLTSLLIGILGIVVTIILSNNNTTPTPNPTPVPTTTQVACPPTDTEYPTKTLILVTDFKNDIGTTSEIIEKLSSYVGDEDSEDMRVGALRKVITTKDVAIAEGKKCGATFVIWGSYEKIKERNQQTRMFVHFETTKPLTEVNTTEIKEKYRRTPNARDIFSYEFPRILSSEMAYLSLYAIGIIHYNRNDWDKAVSRFDAAIKIATTEITTVSKSDLSKAYFKRGNAYYYQKLDEKAIADYQEATKLDDKFADAYTNIGLIYLDKVDNNAAIFNFTKVVTLTPNDSRAYNNLAWVLAQTGNYNKALVECQKGIEREEQDEYLAAAYDTCGYIQFNMGGYKSAIISYTEAITLAKEKDVPSLPEYYEHRGDAYSEARNYEKAISDYTEVISRVEAIDRNDVKLADLYAKRAGNKYKLFGMSSSARDDDVKAQELKAKNLPTVTPTPPTNNAMSISRRSSIGRRIFKR